MAIKTPVKLKITSKPSQADYLAQQVGECPFLFGTDEEKGLTVVAAEVVDDSSSTRKREPRKLLLTLSNGSVYPTSANWGTPRYELVPALGKLDGMNARQRRREKRKAERRALKD